MSDKLANYKRAEAPLPDKNLAWPLYGAGLENLGVDDNPIEIPVPEYGPDELLVRHDAVGLCFSDIKVIRLGPDHPRIYRDMQAEPVVLGHEVSLTVVAVGTSLPELATSVAAAFKGETDIALGNIIGSNLFNILAIMGTAAVIAPVSVPVPPGFLDFDFPVMVGAAVVVLKGRWQALVEDAPDSRFAWQAAQALRTSAGAGSWRPDLRWPREDAVD